MSNSTPEKQSFRDRLHEIIFETHTLGGAVFDVTLLILIVLSIIAISLETVEGIGWVSRGEEGIVRGTAGKWLYLAKWFFTIIFTAEYVLRIYAVKRPWNYIFSFWGVIDLLSFLPDYLMVLLGAHAHGFAVVRSLRLLRVFRIFKLGYFQLEAEDLGGAMWRSRAKIIVFVSVVMILVTVSGTVMYEIENGIGEHSQFKSIPDGIYWAIVTMTTVGYGDIVPLTVPGKFLSAFLILAGYSLIIVPTGVVSSEVIQSVNRKKATTISCRSCITEGHDFDAKFCKYCGESL
jgi:voltage-gated potassium channel